MIKRKRIWFVAMMLLLLTTFLPTQAIAEVAVDDEAEFSQRMKKTRLNQKDQIHISIITCRLYQRLGTKT
ncbi:hypothetical protein [Bacillus sp. JCM 19041]|uniref:hypothetical protein n=1 Tax=Bacillus sp. JCM 19041 TaxID=1460637 RepID=UPI0006D04F45